MEPDSALIGVAEIAVAIAGFSGIAAALRHGAAHTWPRADRDRFVDLLTHSGIALFASLIPLVFGYRGGLDPDLWATSSFFWASCGAIGIGMSMRRSRGRGRALQAPANLVVTGMFFGVLLLQVYNVAVLRAFWPYLAGLIMNLSFAFMQFMALAIPGVEPE
jgi:hypothetical protein